MHIYLYIYTYTYKYVYICIHIYTYANSFIPAPDVSIVLNALPLSYGSELYVPLSFPVFHAQQHRSFSALGWRLEPSAAVGRSVGLYYMPYRVHPIRTPHGWLIV